MNLGIFTGRIGRDAEARTLPGGDKVCNFPVAVDVGNKTEPKTMWLDCSMWGKRGESLLPYLVKGTKITVSGRVQVEDYKRKDGTNGYRLSVNLDAIDLHSAPPVDRERSAQDDQPF